MFDTDAYVFELPVYSLSEDRYYDEFCTYKERLVERLCRGGGSREDHQEFVNGLPFLLEEFGGRWRYNQIVGFVGVLPLGCQLRGEIWLSTAKRIQRKLRYKRIEHRAKGFEMTVKPEDDSEHIFLSLLDNLRALGKGSLLRRRHLDFRAIMAVGPLVNWRELINKSTERAVGGARKRDVQVGRVPHNHGPADG
jgi:hypothetical protein